MNIHPVTPADAGVQKCAVGDRSVPNRTSARALPGLSRACQEAAVTVLF